MSAEAEKLAIKPATVATLLRDIRYAFDATHIPAKNVMLRKAYDAIEAQEKIIEKLRRTNS